MIFLILTIIQSSLSPEVMEISYLHSSSVLLLQAIFSYKCLEFKKKKKHTSNIFASLFILLGLKILTSTLSDPLLLTGCLSWKGQYQVDTKGRGQGNTIRTLLLMAHHCHASKHQGSIAELMLMTFPDF